MTRHRDKFLTYTRLADDLALDRHTLRAWIAGGLVPAPDLELLNGRRAYSPMQADAVRAAVEAQYRPVELPADTACSSCTPTRLCDEHTRSVPA